MPRHKYIRNLTTVSVDREVVEQLKKLKQSRGEPLGEVIRRLVKEHLTRVREVISY